jgi:predicted dehydrogenase
VKFIQVGVGGFGRQWIKTLHDNRAVQIVGLVDVNDAALKSVCQEYGYAADICFPNLSEAVAQTEADAVVSCTPPACHCQDVVTALQAGLHVISEKPMAESMASCRAMLETAQATGKLYVVSQNYRYMPVSWTAARIIAGGRLGRIGQVKVDFYKGVDFGGGFRHSMDYPLIVDMSIHHFDLMRFITGLDAVSVQGTAWNPFWSNYRGDCSSTALFTMSNDARLLYNASWCAKGDFCGWSGNWQIECEHGTLQMQGDTIRILWTDGLYKVVREETVPVEDPPFFGQQYVLHDFMEAVATGTRPKTDAEDNIKSIAMVFATVEAMQSGRKVNVLNTVKG